MHDPLRLLLDACLELRQTALVDGELGLELGDERRERADVAAERVDPLAGGQDLGGEDALLLLGGLDVRPQAGDPPIQFRLPIGSGLAERRGNAQDDERAEKRCGEADAPTDNHRNEFRRECRAPCASPPGVFGLERPLL